jgi:HSF-type DNA-binding
MNQDMINYPWKASMDNDMIFRDTIMQSLLLQSSVPKHTIPLTWLIKQQLLQKRQYFPRTNIFLKNLTNQALTEAVARLDPNYSLLDERQHLIRSQTLTSLAYREAFQRIQNEDVLALTQVRRNVENTNNPPLEIHVEQDDTLTNKGGSEITCNDETKNQRNQKDPTHTFPCILHEILSNPEYSEIITWLPHGQAWRIIRRAQFERVVIPRHFRHGRYSSFMRQVG